MADWYVDLEASAGTGAGTSFANRAGPTAFATIVNGAANGDTVRVKASPDPVSLGSCTWTKNSTITIPANTVKEIYSDGAWTGATNVTTSASTTASLRKQGANVAVMTIASAFTTGRVAHYPLGSAQNFSGYTKISLWFRSSVAITNLSGLYIALCSDTAGTTVVDTLTLPAVSVAANSFIPLVLDKGSALGSSIQSVAIYATVNPGVPTIYLDNIFATNTITLRSLISKNTSGEPWYSIRAIDSTAVTLDMGLNSAVNIATRGYPGETETVNTFISEGIFNSITTVTAAATAIYSITKVATAASGVTISGGWNRTDMSTRTGVTHFGARNCLGGAINVSGSYLTFENFIVSHCSSSFLTRANYLTFNNCCAVATSSAAFTGSGNVYFITLSNCFINNSTTSGFLMAAGCALVTLSNCKSSLNTTTGFTTAASYATLNSCEAKNNYNTGFELGAYSNVVLSECVSENNRIYGINLTGTLNAVIRNTQVINNSTLGILAAGCSVRCYNLSTSNNQFGAGPGISMSAGALVQLFGYQKNESSTITALADFGGDCAISIDEDGTAGNHAIYQFGATTRAVTDVVHTAGGISWRTTVSSALRTSAYPIVQELKGIPVKSGVSHTASVWVRRASSLASIKFGIEDQAVAGISAQSATISVGTNTWEKLSITFTPTEDAVVNFYVHVWGTNVGQICYWDDFEIVAAQRNDVRSGDYGYLESGVFVASYASPEVSSLFLS